jgi:predicted Zn finger-like uncharacterized protein
MILTCPECASRYLVDDASVGPAGRAVRCSACGARWTAHAEAPRELAAPPAALGSPPAETAVAAPAPEPLGQLFHERPAPRGRRRRTLAAGAAWAGVAAGLAMLLGTAVLLRQDIAQVWPRTAGAYAMVGLPVNLVGLAIENPHAQPQFQNGHDALMITGALRNIRDRPVIAPPLRISLLNLAGRPLAVKIADPGGASIPAGATRGFAVNLLDPPVGAAEVDIALVLDHRPSREGSTPASGPPPARLPLSGAAPADRAPAPGPIAPAAPAREVQPLPPSSPYALPKTPDSAAGPRG